MGNDATGAARAVITKRAKYGADVFSKNGKKGGEARNKSKKRFSPFSDPEFAREMGRKSAAKRWGKVYEEKQ